MGKIRCPECRYRAAKFSDYTCDYAGITGHTRRAVPPEALREEILRSKLEMLTRIAAIAGVEGALELEVTINEQIRAVRPIKLEDRLRHMNEKNPLLAELRRELDLEVE